MPKYPAQPGWCRLGRYLEHSIGTGQRLPTSKSALYTRKACPLRSADHGVQESPTSSRQHPAHHGSSFCFDRDAVLAKSGVAQCEARPPPREHVLSAWSGRARARLAKTSWTCRLGPPGMTATTRALVFAPRHCVMQPPLHCGQGCEASATRWCRENGRSGRAATHAPIVHPRLTVPNPHLASPRPGCFSFTRSEG